MGFGVEEVRSVLGLRGPGGRLVGSWEEVAVCVGFTTETGDALVLATVEDASDTFFKGVPEDDGVFDASKVVADAMSRVTAWPRGASVPPSDGFVSSNGTHLGHFLASSESSGTSTMSLHTVVE